MSSAPFRHLAGDIVSDLGWLSLAEAEALAGFYAAEAARETGAAGRRCEARARALAAATREARLWRRAAGWTDGPQADAAP